MDFSFKNALAVCLIIFVFWGCKKQDVIEVVEEKTFPVDAEFEKHLYSLGIDHHLNGLLRYSEIQTVDSLNFNRNGITSLKGIEHFENLRTLIIFDTRLDSLDLSRNTKLEYLSCLTIDAEDEYRSLTFLDVNNCTGLKYLNCSSNLISTLSLGSNTALRELRCGDNPNIKELDLSRNIALEVLNCGFIADLSKLDLSKNTNLKKIMCADTKLQDLDMSMLPELKMFDCRGTNISNLNLKNAQTLEELYITDSKITSVDFNLFPSLHSLAFGSNLTSFDLTPLHALKVLDCFRVQADKIDITSNSNLEHLSLRFSNFKNLDLSHSKSLQILSLFNMTNLISVDLSNSPKLDSFGSVYNYNLK